MNFKTKTFMASVTGTTAVARVIHAFGKCCAVVKRFCASGNDALSAVTWYLARSERSFRLLIKQTAVATSVRIPADTAGGHVFKGKTLTTSFKLLLPYGSDGWTVAAISAVTDVADADYCTVTVSATGAVVPKGSLAYVLSPADDIIAGLPAVGNANVALENVISGDAGCPMVFSVVSAADKTCLASAYVEYQG